jgi:hypothetical protein
MVRRVHQEVCSRGVLPRGGGDSDWRLDDAWAKLEASRAPFSREDYVAAAREILAKQIISAAQRGERNRRQLTEDALFEVHLA